MRKRASELQPVYAVLTGDLIGSTRLAFQELNATRTILESAVQRFQERDPAAVVGRPEFFRGDAWQLVLAKPGLALRVSLLLRASLRYALSIDTRISVGIGNVDHIDRKRISLSTGEAFTLSGHALDEMTIHFDLTGALPERAEAMAVWLPVIFHLCSGLVRPWTRRQAEIISLALILDEPKHEVIAKTLEHPVSKQTVTESLGGASWRPLLDAMKAFEGADWTRITRSSPTP